MTIHIDADKCNGCGLCDNGCPVDIFRIDEKKKKAYAAYPEQCWNCRACEWDCPEDAIKVDLHYLVK